MQRRMLEESQKMVTDSSKRLGAAVQELRALLVCLLDVPPAPSFLLNSVASMQLAAEKNPEIAKDPAALSAQEVLEEVSV